MEEPCWNAIPRPIVEVRAANTGSQDNRSPLTATVAGSVLRFVRPPLEPEEGSAEPYRLEIVQFASYAELEPHGRAFEPTAAERAEAAAQPSPETVRHADATAGLVVACIRSVPGLSAVRVPTRG